MKRAPRGFLSFLGLIVFGLLAGVLLAEAACKAYDVWDARRDEAVARRISRPSTLPDVRFELIPKVTAPTPDMPQLVRVNAHGFRGPDLLRTKPDNGWRLAVLGDSIAFGRTLPEEAIFPSILGRLLQERFPDRVVEVMNASLSGRDTWEEASILEHRVLPLHPDFVVLQVCLNDHVRLPKETGVRHGVFGERPWYGYSSLLALFDERIEGFRGRRVRMKKALGMDTRTAAEIVHDKMITQGDMLRVEENWEAWQEPLGRIDALCGEHGVRWAIVVFPIELQIRRGDPETLPLLREWAEERGIQYVDLLPVMAVDFPARLRDYTHPSAAGHQAVAEHLAERIAERVLGDDEEA